LHSLADIDYSFKSIDPESEELFYWIEWGDGSVEEWIGPYPSSEKIKINHSWTEGGTYTIKAKAKDINNLEGDLGSFKVIIPRNRRAGNSWLQLLIERFPNLFILLSNLIR